jgi:hypothetical protein
MSNTKQTIKGNQLEEQIELSFLGLKFKSSNPNRNTIIILLILLIFFVVLVVLLQNPALLKWLSG